MNRTIPSHSHPVSLISARTGQIKESLALFESQPNSAGVRLPITTTVLGCSNATVWRLAKEGKLKAIKVSPRVTVFNVGSIRALLNGGIA